MFKNCCVSPCQIENKILHNEQTSQSFKTKLVDEFKKERTKKSSYFDVRDL